MPEKTLYMIGNSHIDPVWYWSWEEGMQAVKATFAAVLDRMHEYPDFRFTSTSIAFLTWMEKIQPQMFKEIQQRVAQGRWELTGGWFIEPDCIIPCGESFVRQGLYSQRFLLSRFGKICRIGSNVDSFGHGDTLPMLLSKCRMNSYVFMRPRLETSVFIWESNDGSKVTALSLPAEYTTWFAEPTRRNIELTLERTPKETHMACCYGVGNHGGGPTKENIETIRSQMDAYAGVSLKFSGFSEFFQHLDAKQLPTLIGAFEGVNTGCYSNDLELKRMNRLAEKRLMEADILLCMSKVVSGKWLVEHERIQPLWEQLLFNQFHDILCGTSIKTARDEAIMNMSSSAAGAAVVQSVAIQSIVNTVDTSGEGHPLFLFNPLGYEFVGSVEIEVEWYCKTSLTIVDPQGKEVLYQRVFTAAKATHFNIGGRRRIVFHAQIPPMGFCVYRLFEREPKVAANEKDYIEHTEIGPTYREIENPLQIENDYLRAIFNTDTGFLTALIDKTTNYNALDAPFEARVWIDQRDTWGHEQDGLFKETGESSTLESIETIESGPLRQVVKVISLCGSSRMEQRFILHENDDFIIIQNRMVWDRPWHLLKFRVPLARKNHLVIHSETAYGIQERYPTENKEYYMHRYLDAKDVSDGSGLLIANTNTHAFMVNHDCVELTMLRSPIHAQHKSVQWYNAKESYDYSNLGEHRFNLALTPHGQPLSSHKALAIADFLTSPYEYLLDNKHPGTLMTNWFSMVNVDAKNIRICVAKKAEDDDDVIFRVWETAGKSTNATLTFLGTQYPFEIGGHEVMTVKLDTSSKTLKTVDLLEWSSDMDVLK